jgi:glyoxylase-like metal-dependent hydrolase (beta-lactamase superfamily II)
LPGWRCRRTIAQHLELLNGNILKDSGMPTVPDILRIPILPWHMVNAHLIRGARGAVLVDAGLPGSEARFARVLARAGMAFTDIKLIVITHAHVDHAGGAAHLRRLSRAPIVAHAGDRPYYRRDVPMQFCATSRFGRLFKRLPLIHQPYDAFDPDILLAQDDTLDLARYGIDGVVRRTPGHTAGSLSVELVNHTALVGDLVASGVLLGGILRKHRAMRPPFEDDPHAVSRTLLSLLDRGMEQFYLGHGGPLGAQEVRRHAHALAEMG